MVKSITVTVPLPDDYVVSGSSPRKSRTIVLDSHPSAFEVFSAPHQIEQELKLITLAHQAIGVHKRSLERAQITERRAFRAWQNNYNTDHHGYIEGEDEGLTLEVFRQGGIRGHAAPRCPDCDPEITLDTAQTIELSPGL